MNRIKHTPSAAAMLAVAFILLGSVAIPARAQGHSQTAEIKKKMEDISRLMRESERLLLEMTMIDRLVEQQRRVIEELKKLETPKEEQPSEATPQKDPKADPNQEQAAEKQMRDDLVKKQRELRKKLEDLFKNQDAASKMSVTQLEELLRNLPSGGGGGHSRMPTRKKPNGDPKPQEGEEKKQRDKKGKEQKGDEKPQDGETRDDQKPESKRNKDAQANHIQVWIARLPRAQQERISRGDFSGFPSRYRRLLREYTRRRAKREAEDRDDER
jgi:hypothetical protein